MWGTRISGCLILTPGWWFLCALLPFWSLTVISAPGFQHPAASTVFSLMACYKLHSENSELGFYNRIWMMIKTLVGVAARSLVPERHLPWVCLWKVVRAGSAGSCSHLVPTSQLTGLAHLTWTSCCLRLFSWPERRSFEFATKFIFQELPSNFQVTWFLSWIVLAYCL